MHSSAVAIFPDLNAGSSVLEGTPSQVVAASLPPWLTIDAFPMRSQEYEYGYMSGKRLKNCSRQELIIRCRSEQVPAIHLVWTPETPRLVPPTEVEFLLDSVKAKVKHSYRTQLVVAVLNLFSLGILPLMTLDAKDVTIRRFLILNCVMLVVVPIAGALYGLLKSKGLTSEQIAKERTHIQYATWVATRRIVLTWVLAACILAIWIVQMVTGLERSVTSAGLVKEDVWRGQVWRLATGPMLHGGVLHILFNGVALLGLGRLAEVLADRAYLAIVFLASMLAGSLFSLFILPHTSSVGASGGLMGLIGFSAVVGYRRQDILPPRFFRSVVINVLLMAAIGVIAFGIIDNAAHLGGFVCGVLLGLLLVRPQGGLPLRPPKGIRRLGNICSFMIVALAVATVWIVLPGAGY